MNANTKPKLIAIETHPIQYKSPLFRALAARADIDFNVLYAMIPDATQQGAGFGVSFAWDLPLLDGYNHDVLENVSKSPGVTHFSGCDTPGVYDVLKRERPDAVLVNGWVVKTCLQALWACRQLGIPCLVRGEANLLRPRAWWKHLLHRMLLRQYSGYLYIGSANRAFYRFHGCPDRRMFFAPYSVDNDFFMREAAARKNRRDDLRAGFGLDHSTRVFLFVGKLEEKKHPADIIHAAALLPPDLKTSITLLFVGDGPLRQMLEEESRRVGVNARFAGFMNQTRLPDAYAAADVLILPSDAGETWGLVVNEAMASARPAIVSDQAGCAGDLVVDGVTGYRYPCRNVSMLERCMMAYLEQPSRASAHGQQAAAHIAMYGINTALEGVISALAMVKA